MGGGGWSLYDFTFCLAAWSHDPLGGLCPWSHVSSRGVYPGGSLSKGLSMSGRSLSLVPCSFQVGLYLGESLSKGWSMSGVLCPGGLCRKTRPLNQKSGRYASYWNAFLYCCCTAKTYVDFLQVFRLEMTQWFNEVLLDVIF